MTVLNGTKLNSVTTDFQKALKALYGDRLVRLILFGSYARGEATDDSDIDIMVVLSGEISPGDEILRMGSIKTELNLKYDELISVLPISLADYENRKTPLLDNIRREGIDV